MPLTSGRYDPSYPGLSQIEVYPEIETHDDLGNPIRIPGDLYCTLWVALHPVVAAENSQDRIIDTTTMKTFITKALVPASAWGKVVTSIDRREWAVVGEPVIGQRMGITKVTIRALTGPVSVHGY